MKFTYISAKKKSLFQTGNSNKNNLRGVSHLIRNNNYIKIRGYDESLKMI
jgi:hypothetical protein